MTPTPPQEWTKDDDTALTVPANAIITTKINRAIVVWAAAATIRCALPPKVASRSWAIGRATRGHHSVHSGRTKKNPCNRIRRKGVTVEPMTRGTTDLMISDQPATPYHRTDPPPPTLDTTNPNPNRLGSSSPPRIYPLGNQVIHRVI
jgi:hypothetical protein